jgi:hypothetical protein
MVHRFIRREDDIDRSGGVPYSPTPRDDAQQFRSDLLVRLVATGQPDVSGVLRELMTEPELAPLSDYIRHLLEKHRDQLAEAVSWRASDVRKFAAEYEREPQTDGDLFRLALGRLRDLKQLVEVGEDSPRKEVHAEDNEAGFRDWLRRRLNESTRGRFVVAPEWEIVGGRPDLRVVIPGVAPVSIELKIADNWTLPELIDGLEKQLVGAYLRDDRARFGLYVLALFNRKRLWVPLAEGPRIGCAEVFAILQQRVADVLATRSDIAGLDVVLILFSSPEP